MGDPDPGTPPPEQKSERAPTFTYAGPDLRGHAEQLREKKAAFREMGGPERIERQHGEGKLTVRERLDLLFDADTFNEFGLLAHHMSSSPQMQGKNTPADGVVTGVGTIDGRRVAVIAYDFTVMAGSIGMVGELKATRMRVAFNSPTIPIEPAITVKSYAITATFRPSTRPMPVTTPSAGVCLPCICGDWL